MLNVLRILHNVASGVAHLHSISIVHRDLKSLNLLLTASGFAKVTDFGCARQIKLTASLSRVGTVQWAAPELILGTAYNAKVDVWSFGVICWELLECDIPYGELKTIEVARKVALGNLRLRVPSRGPVQLLRLIGRCFAEQTQRPDFQEILSVVTKVPIE